MSASYLDEARLSRSIVAIATAVGEGAIGIVRLSGQDSIRLGASVFSCPDDILAAKSHTIHFGDVRSGTGATIDNVLVSVMRAPRTYTGEDVIELHAHGGRIQVERVLRVCVDAGALPALPGEFTFRAFMNGKVDLTQAEAVADMIGAQTDVAARVALEQSDGVLRNRFEGIRNGILNLRVRCEATIDFVDDDIPDVERPVLIDESERMLRDLSLLVSSYGSGRLIREGARVVLSGAPNVGKSSIFNALLRSDRAIVTEIAGTTRDAVTESLDIMGLPVILADTAGMRDSDDVIEREGVARSQKYRSAADLVLEVVDSRSALEKLPGHSGEIPYLLVCNKIDLLDGQRIAALRDKCPQAVLVSAVAGNGLADLCSAIYDRLLGNRWSGEEPLVTRRRHFEGLVACREAMVAFLEAVKTDEPLELAALELRTALAAIDELVGRVYDEDVLNRIFGEFCIGK